ncbi:hypothetical protein [Sanguibacter suaedae]|uniref:Uncharacterized protein n=1 Tax=Sanguibacter suaedae TaxID=2795737 RepID=A0A934I981_9MICO|nr:hypothetical protein [Sanguibacter suaedae]MBI9113550.1 hypothetical protein [Sanguibacter suaedae]
MTDRTQDEPRDTFRRYFLVTWPLAIMVIGMSIVRIQNGVWWNEVVTTMVVSGLVVSCAMAVYAARKDRAVRRQAATSEPERG